MDLLESGAVLTDRGTVERIGMKIDNSVSGYCTYNQKNINRTVSRFAPNAPDEVKEAYVETALETGYSEESHMDYISQLLIHQVEKRQNGVANYTDVFGNSVGSALKAAKELLYDLEHPLTPLNQRGEHAAQYIEQEIEFYKAFIEKLEKADGIKETIGSEAESMPVTEPERYTDILEKRINEIFTKVQSGDTEPTYQIGSQSFTEKEWDALMEKFDSVQEAIRAIMQEEKEKAEKEEEQKQAQLLSVETTTCMYETANPKDEDLHYITWYTEDGIFCRKAGQTGEYEWVVPLENEGQYEKVMDFIGQFSSDWNLRFAAHENFWNDFLNDAIDMDGFMEFISETNKGVPNFSLVKEDSVYVDKEKMQWAKYTNPLDVKFYTAEEMNRMQAEIIAANEAKLTKLTDWDAYEGEYKKIQPGYNGEKICCEYPGGPLYTVKEMAELQWRKMLEQMGITEEEYYARNTAWKAKMGYPGYES